LNKYTLDKALEKTLTCEEFRNSRQGKLLFMGFHEAILSKKLVSIGMLLLSLLLLGLLLLLLL